VRYANISGERRKRAVGGRANPVETGQSASSEDTPRSRANDSFGAMSKMQLTKSIAGSTSV
jgi:hypothetical protein